MGWGERKLNVSEVRKQFEWLIVWYGRPVDTVSVSHVWTGTVWSTHWNEAARYDCAGEAAEAMDAMGVRYGHLFRKPVRRARGEAGSGSEEDLSQVQELAADEAAEVST